MANTLLDLFAGFQNICNPASLLFLLLGVTLGTIVGALPGMGAATGTSILLPLTFNLTPTNSLVMLSGLYYGTHYGGALTAILLNVPGTTGAAITAIDGYQMMLKGRAGKALGASQFSSFIGGMVSTVLLAFSGVALARLAVRFTAPEYFALTLMGLMLVASLTGKSPVKGFTMMFLGLACGCIGLDNVSGALRYTFGSIYLTDGLKSVPILIGLLGFSELILTLEKGGKNAFTQLKESRVRPKDLLLDKEEWRDCLPASLRGSVIGFVVGALPGAGATIASVLTYSYQKKKTRHPEIYGSGAADGVAAAESSNNASCGGAMVPMLSLGIPGSPTAAILLTALMMFGIQPGPQLYRTNGSLVWALIASMFIGNIMLLILNIGFIPLFLKTLQKVQRYLIPMVSCLCIVGVYSLNKRIFDIWVMLIFAVLGYFLRKSSFPTLPFILGLILGPSAEGNFRKALILSGGKISIFITRPICCFMMVICVGSVLFQLFKFYKSAKDIQHSQR